MLANGSLISCNFSSFPLKKIHNPKHQFPNSTDFRDSILTSSLFFVGTNFHSSSNSNSSVNGGIISKKTTTIKKRKQFQLQKWCCYSSLDTDRNPRESAFSDGDYLEEEVAGAGGGGNGSDEERDWTTSFLLFGLWAGLMFYIFFLAPNQTPMMDSYFLKKLLNLKGNDGFKMNEILVALWYIMGLYPLLYSMLLFPTARSSKGSIPLWPFLVLSFIGGAYALIPYFVLWRPPPPQVEEQDLKRWPLNVLESKLTAGVTMAAGIGLIVYAGLSNGDVWKEFYQYFRESRFIHATSIDFTLLSAFAPFWVYNDMTNRKWDDKGFWLLPISIIPVLGPALYLLLRPPLSEVPALVGSLSEEEEEEE